jgi:hypothetical protein
MPELILGLVYISAAAAGVVLLASGLYGSVPLEISFVCSDEAIICQAPYIALPIPVAFGYLYRLAVAQERSRRVAISRWRLKLRRLLS